MTAPADASLSGAALPPEHESPLAAMLTMIVGAVKMIGDDVYSVEYHHGEGGPPGFLVFAARRPAGFDVPVATTDEEWIDGSKYRSERHRVGPHDVSIMLPHLDYTTLVSIAPDGISRFRKALAERMPGATATLVGLVSPEFGARPVFRVDRVVGAVAPLLAALPGAEVHRGPVSPLADGAEPVMIGGAK